MVNIIKSLAILIHRHPMKARLFLVLLLFAILIYNIRPAEIIAAFSQVQLKYIIYAVILMIPNLLIQVFKWRFILRDLKPVPSLKMTSVSVFGGFFLGFSTPGRTGELARGILMPGYSTVKIASLSFVDKGFNQLIILLAGFISLGFNIVESRIPWHLSLIPFVLVPVVLVILFNIHRVRPYIERLLHRFTKSEMVDNALAAFDALSLSTVLGMLAYSIPFYLIFTFQYYCILYSFSPISLEIAMRTIPMIFTASIFLPVAIGDFGVKEMFAVNLLAPFGIAGGQALSATTTQNVITFLVPSLIGGIVIMVSAHRRPNQEGVASDDRSNHP